jgi:hypothetical protein
MVDEVSKVIAEDPTAYEYDTVYDNIQADR